jgi:hypothetical protein
MRREREKRSRQQLPFEVSQRAGAARSHSLCEQMWHTWREEILQREGKFKFSSCPLICRVI